MWSIMRRVVAAIRCFKGLSGSRSYAMPNAKKWPTISSELVSAFHSYLPSAVQCQVPPLGRQSPLRIYDRAGKPDLPVTCSKNSIASSDFVALASASGDLVTAYRKHRGRVD